MGKFEVKETKNGYVFNLKATNGEVIASSQVYKTLVTLNKGVKSVKANCEAQVEDQTVEGFETVKHPKFEVYKDKADEFRFRLKAKNGQIVATSEGYKTKANCLNGVASVSKNAKDAEVVTA